MHNRRRFAFLENVFFPAIVCNSKNRIVYKNSSSECIAILPKNGINIESVTIKDEGGECYPNNVFFRKLRSYDGIFRTALIVPFESTELEEYSCWIFDISFQFLDRESERYILSNYREFRFPVGENYISGNGKESASFRRLCELLCISAVGTASGRRIAYIGRAVPELLYTVKDTLAKFGIKMSVELFLKSDTDYYIDFASHIYSVIYMLMLSVPLAKGGYINISSGIADKKIKTEFSFVIPEKNESYGEFGELKNLFPEKNLLLTFAEMLFNTKSIDFSFNISDSLMKLTLYQNLSQSRTMRLNQPIALDYTEDCLLNSILMMLCELLFRSTISDRKIS